MSAPRCDPRLQRNVLLYLAAALFLASLAAGLRPWLALTTRQVFYDSAAAALLGLIAPYPVFLCVAGKLDRNQRPWYAQKGAMRLVLVGLLCYDLFCAVPTSLACWLNWINPADSSIPVSAGILLGVAAQLASVALINWPFWILQRKQSGPVPAER